jgi:hypothetical protein
MSALLFGICRNDNNFFVYPNSTDYIHNASIERWTLNPVAYSSNVSRISFDDRTAQDRIYNIGSLEIVIAHFFFGMRRDVIIASPDFFAE